MFIRKVGSGGQVLVGVILLLLVLAILVPAMVLFVQNEAKWTAKEQKNTNAFHLGEAATERGYWRISQSTMPTQIIPVTGYKFDQSYSDISGGTYALNIGSDSSKNIIITGVGRDSLQREVRAVQVIYSPPSVVNDALFGTGTVNIEVSGAARVEWGPIYTQSTISGVAPPGNAGAFPRLYAVGGGTPPPVIQGYCNGTCPAAPCTDLVHYWCCSCVPYVNSPQLDFNYYKTQAQSYGVSPPLGCGRSGSCPGTPGTESYYNPGCFIACTDTSGRVYYNDTGDINFSPANDGGRGGGNYIVGSLILAVGSSINASGNSGNGSYTANVPAYAWKEYGQNSGTWAHYKTFDPAAPANFPGLSSSYQASGATFSLTNVMVHGLFWDEGDINVTGGQIVIHGVAVVRGATVSGNVLIYYDTNTGSSIHTTTGGTYTRTSWKDLPSQGWPAGLP